MAVPTSNITLASIQQEFGGAAANRRLKNYYGAAAGVPASGAIKFKDFAGKSADIVGSQLFESSGTFTVPAGVTKVHVVCVGGGGNGAPVIDQPRGGGAGGACAYKNNIAVTPGQQIAVNVTIAGDIGMEVGSYFKNTSTCNARTGFQTATSLGANNTGDAYFRGGMGGTGGSAKLDMGFLGHWTYHMGGGGGGAASMVSSGGRGGNSPNPGTGGFSRLPLAGGNGLTSSRAGAGGGGAGSYVWYPPADQINPDYLPVTGSSQAAGYGYASQKGGGVGVEYAGPTGAAGIGSQIDDPYVGQPTKGGRGSNGNYGRGGGAGTNNGATWYIGSAGAVRVKWGATNTYPWATEG